MFNLVNRAKKKNNKGFSLVELIVVVLIIAIIAVALAPQVMKYVGKARTSTSENTAASIKSSVQAAVAEYQGQANATTAAIATKFKVAQSNSAITDNGGTKNINTYTCTSGSSLQTLIEQNLGSDKLDATYAVEISGSAITVGVAS